MTRGVRAARWVASSYRFQPVREPGAWRVALRSACLARGLTGTVLIAPEGVNAALCGSETNLRAVLTEHFPNAQANWTPVASGVAPFDQLKVLERAEIVTFGAALDSKTPVGRHVHPRCWSQLIDRPDVLALDVRNDYESAIGTFRGAMPAATTSFRGFEEFARHRLSAHRDRTIAMFCTGGIRCEKASAHLLQGGFKDVRQLRGGILSYLRSEAPANAFTGECFVFDGRVSLKPDLSQGEHRLCAGCGRPTPRADGALCLSCGNRQPGAGASGG